VNEEPVIRNFSFCLVHTPDLVRFGAKPRRELAAKPELADKLFAALRSLAEAEQYPPNQVFVGNLTPAELGSVPRPWFECSDGDEQTESTASGAFGEIVGQDLFYAMLKRADVLEPALFELTDTAVTALNGHLAEHPVFASHAAPAFRALQVSAIRDEIESGSLPIFSGRDLLGCFRRDNRAEGQHDENLAAHFLLEDLCVKASGAIALEWLLHREQIGPDQIDYVISCGEEACGDRYQRGGGGMAKAIGEMCGCMNASGMDIKNFCAAPASALVTAGALVKAGVYERVAVVAGGSLAKLGMKFEAFLNRGTPILDDCLACMAFLVTRDDGQSPILRLERGAVGLASIGSSTSDEAVYRSLILDPLSSLGLSMTDVDRYAPELHNPEIMEYAGSGDVAKKNYRTIAALAVLDGQIEKSGMAAFIEQIGMPGFAPTQGHIPSAVPYIGHAAREMQAGQIHRAMFLCKASLFLNRLTELFDGVSFVLEANPASRGKN